MTKWRTVDLLAEILERIASLALGAWAIVLVVRWGIGGFGLDKFLAFAIGLTALSLLYDIHADQRKAARS